MQISGKMTSMACTVSFRKKQFIKSERFSKSVIQNTLKNNIIMRKLIKFLLSGISLFTILISCKNDKNSLILLPDEPTYKTVFAQKVTPINYRETIYASGKISSKEATKLSFRANGQIQNIKVKVGENVKKGQLLAVLNTAAIGVAYQQAQLSTEQAAIAIKNTALLLKKAERDYQNTLGLYQDSVATLEQLQNAELQVASTKNQLEAAQKKQEFGQQQQSAVQINRQYSTIVAPSNGKILQKYVSNQETVQAGRPILLFVGQQKTKIIKVNITDKAIIHLAFGDSANVHFDAYPNYTFKGQVIEIAQMADPILNTFEVQIRLASTSHKLYDGFIGHAALTTGKSQALISIPIDALVNADGNKGKIYVLEKGKAVATNIQIYKLEKEQLLVAKGLDKNQQVIISGTGYIDDDETVVAR